MKRESQERMFERFTQKQKDVLLSKGNDYANEDVLSNFKLSGSICGITAELNCLSLMATKVARLGVLLNSKEAPKNESIEDSILDLANYTFLLKCLINDK
jgi:hypothetical protein